MADLALLLPSPLLPASAYVDLAGHLGRTGADVLVADPSLADTEGAGDLVDRWARLAPDCRWLLAHSNAGYLAPAVRAASGSSAPIVYMDAALPGPGSTALAPVAFYHHLASLADDRGLLPPWTRWWPRENLADVIPAGFFDELDAACPRLPLRYFTGRVGVPHDWLAGAPNAYLAFGDTYAEEMDRARLDGWPVEVLDGGHLHFLHDARGVTAAIARLLERLATP